MFQKDDKSIYRQREIEAKRQQAIVKYRRLSRLEKSKLSLDEQLFIENFEAAMYCLWGFKGKKFQKSEVESPG